MSNLVKIDFESIFLFDTANGQSLGSNPLKDFLYYLKYSGQRGVIDFSYSWERDSLHNNMSIKENLLLDSIPTSLIRDGENNLKEFFKTLENPYLTSLIDYLGNLNEIVSNLDEKNLKLTSLIKALVSKSEFVFLVDPDNFQDDKLIEIIKDCIQFEVKTYKRKFLIKSSNLKTWTDISTHLITKDQNQSYIKTANINRVSNNTDTHTILTIPFKKVS